MLSARPAPPPPGRLLGCGAAKKHPAPLGHAGHRRPARAAQRGQALDFSWILGPPSEEILRQNCAQTHSSHTNTRRKPQQQSEKHLINCHFDACTHASTAHITTMHIITSHITATHITAAAAACSSMQATMSCIAQRHATTEPSLVTWRALSDLWST